MLSSHFKLAFRNLRSNPLFSLLNLAGLALGLCVAMLLLLFVRDERSFDTVFPKADRICRVNVTFNYDGEISKLSNAPNAVGPAMRDAVPEVEDQARLLFHNFGESAFVAAGDNFFIEKKFYWADPELIRMFDLPLLAGDPATALNEPNTVMISRSTAEKYYGQGEALGQMIKVDGKYDLRITGVYADFPGNSTLEADCIGSFKSIRWAQNPVWSNSSFETWLLLRPGADIGKTSRQMADLLDRNVPKEEQRYSLSLQPLLDVHLYSGDLERANTTRIGDPKQVKLVGWLALTVLLIACINYMNLATARSQKRFREVGISKTMGATKAQLLTRFYVETGVLVTAALLAGSGLAALALPAFNALADKSLAWNDLFSAEVGWGLLGLAGAMTLLSGLYPALYLSGFSPKNLLQTSFRPNTAAGWLRRSLVVAQFTASVALVICALVFYRQLQFIQTKKLGYAPEQVVAITTAASRDRVQLEGMQQALLQQNGVKTVCPAQTYPGRPGSGRSMTRPGQAGSEIDIVTNRVSAEITDALGLQLLAGATLPALPKADGDTTVQVILNETAAKALGYTPEEAIGKTAPDLFYVGPSEIVGVVADFNFETFHEPIGAYAFHNARTESRNFMLVRFDATDLPAMMQRLEKVFRQYIPGSAFEYTFLDQHLNTLYRAERRTARVVLVFAMLAVFIACLGLFGLAAFAAEQRTKEIGIRKVLGASVASVTGLLAKDFLTLVIVAIAIASPLAGWAMNRWLADFAFRIDIEGWMFGVAGLVAVAVAGLTVSFQSIRAALANPVQALRNE